MRYVSLFSGIEAATVAWHPLGWKPLAFSEIEAFPRAVLAHHYHDVTCHGDMTAVDWSQYRGSADLVVGGSPCQAFSVAGLRKGLADPRGNLTLAYLAAVDAMRPRWVVWENVPGVLSIDGGRTFGTFLGGLGQLGYGFAYRVLDAQFFGVPQRRRRVFVVGHLGDWRRAAAVLFERESLSGNPPPRREAGKGIARPIACGSDSSGGYRNDADTSENLIATPHTDLSPALKARDYKGPSSDGDGDGDGDGAILVPMVAHSLRASGFDASEVGTGRGTPLVPVHCRNVAGALTSNYGKQPDSSDTGLGPNLVAMSVALRGREGGGVAELGDDQANALRASQGGGDKPHALVPVAFNADARPDEMNAADVATLTRSQRAAIAFSAKDHGADAGDIAPTLRAGGADKTHANSGNWVGVVQPAVALGVDVYNGSVDGDVAATLNAQSGVPNHSGPRVLTSAVRRLTPRECERLQGFPDDYTLIALRRAVRKQRKNEPDAHYAEYLAKQPMAADGPRYKALGNSMAVPVMRWIGERIALVGAL